MVELLGNWLMGVTCAAMILALAEGLSPAGGPKRAARLAGGLLLLLAVVKPLLSLDGSALTQAMTEYRLDAEWSAQALEGENKTLMKDIIEAQTAAYIQDKAAALGITCTVQVEADQAAEYPVPKVVTITGALSREEQQRLAAVDEAGILLGQHLQGALPAIPLTGSIALSTAYSNDAVPELVFAQQVWGHGKAGDVLLAISTSGSSKNVYYAIVAAKAKGMVVIGLTGSRQGTMDHLCDICIKAPAEETYQVQEYHLPIYHAICRYVEEKMFAGE